MRDATAIISRRLLRPALLGPEGLDALPSARQLAACVLAGGAIYGAVMGAYGGFADDRALQLFYSAAKVPLLLLVSFLLTLPSFLVAGTLLGLRGDFRLALRALVGAQAALALVLAALAPYTAFLYVSGVDYTTARLFNAAMFGLASLSAQLVLRRLYRPLIVRNRRHRQLLVCWFIAYAFVGIQLGWTLRPFIGAPGMPVVFFRESMVSNAYVFMAKLIWSGLGWGA